MILCSSFVALLILLSSIGCKSNDVTSTRDGLSAEELLSRCREATSEISSVHKVSESWYGGEKGLEKDVGTESFISLPDKAHIVYDVEVTIPEVSGDLVLEHWLFGNEEYIHLYDGRIKKVERSDEMILPESALLENASIVGILDDEVIESRNCYAIEAKVLDELDNIDSGYHKVVLYIDQEEFLLRKVTFERIPIRFPNKDADESFRNWSEIYYMDYNQTFDITPPVVTSP